MQFHINICKATHVPSMDVVSKSDPFVVVVPSFSDKKCQTRWIKDDNNPVWNEKFTFNVKDTDEDYINVELYDYDDIGEHDLIASIQIDIKDFVEGNVLTKVYQMKPGKGIRQSPNITLQMQLAVRGRTQFVPYQIITAPNVQPAK